MKKIILVISVLVAAIFIIRYFSRSKPVDFTTQVKPIFNKNCITCHGGVRQKGGFSLLFREEALAKTKSGKYAIIPGDPSHSEMIRRVNLTDPEERMPYKHDPLSPKDISILRRWIKEGAPWGDHWAYIPLEQVAVPSSKTLFGLITKKSKWARNPIDNFIEQKLNEEGLKPSPVADKPTLLRRAALDLIGMPAPSHLANKFLGDNSEHAYADLVDSLLSSPHYGEKWAALWMDLSRYADTKGYEADQPRVIWQYRDWVIHAFNKDLPYDEFLKEQLAGDLMPDPTDSQYIATAFHRNSMTNDEGGTDNEEFRTSAVIDRVNTTWDAVMGTTFGCVQCHSHPYDPFRHEDYYKFMAFFNDSRDEDTEADYPLLRHYNDTLQKELKNVVEWIKTNVSPEKAKESYTFLKTWQPSYNSLVADSFINSELNSSWWVSFRNHAQCRLKNVDLNKKDHLIFRYYGVIDGGVWKIHLDQADGEVIATIPLPKTKDWEIVETALKPVEGTHHLYFTYTNPLIKNPTYGGALLDWLKFTQPFPGGDKAGYSEIKKEFWKLLRAKVPTTPVMMDNPSDMHRASYVFERGNWMVKGELVEPDVPKSLNPFPSNAPRNRLGLSMWVTSEKNPLTARTIVNRIWEQVFGTGLAETLEDLGSQGIAPTHADLLNWLSYQFMHEYKWSLKKLLRLIITSATYQQNSAITAELLKKDPYNRYYARGVRVRLTSEQIRDQALCISGILSNKMYGPSVFPWQPKGIWLSPWNGNQWEKSNNEDQYRRALYTYWKRTAPYPSMINFDGVSREVCAARRVRTNTPLQALTTLNDSAYIDMARHFARRMEGVSKTDVKEQIRSGFKWATFHEADERSVQALMHLYMEALGKFKKEEEKACEMMGGINGNSNASTAALTVVANAILNLDEVLTKN